MQRRTMLSDNDFPKYSRAHVAISIMVAWRFLKQWPPGWSPCIQQRFLPLAFTPRDCQKSKAKNIYEKNIKCVTVRILTDCTGCVPTSFDGLFSKWKWNAVGWMLQIEIMQLHRWDIQFSFGSILRQHGFCVGMYGYEVLLGEVCQLFSFDYEEALFCIFPFRGSPPSAERSWSCWDRIR